MKGRKGERKERYTPGRTGSKQLGETSEDSLNLWKSRGIINW